MSEMKDGREALEPAEAARAMLAGETLVDGVSRWEYTWDTQRGAFMAKCGDLSHIINTAFLGYIRKPPSPKKRSMTRWEALAWAQSDEARGWLVQYYAGVWRCPCDFDFIKAGEYKRACFTAEGGVDESTIQGFEVEEEEK
jgi:hypothetical protein